MARKQTKDKQPEPNGVVVTLTPTEDGEAVGYKVLGDTRAREVPVILRQAAKVIERQQGA